MRTLKGWKPEEQESFNIAVSRKVSLANIIDTMLHVESSKLYAKYYYRSATRDERNKLVTDIVDLYNHKAKFPDQRWYVQFTPNAEYSYLGQSTEDNTFYTTGKIPDGGTDTQFTKEEVEEINPDFLKFLIPVPYEELMEEYK